MITFEQIISVITRILGTHSDIIRRLEWLVINRDLNGRVRLIMDRRLKDDFNIDDAKYSWIKDLAQAIEPHGYPADRMVLFESSKEEAIQGKPHFIIDDLKNVTVVDRLLTESDWTNVLPESEGAPRIVFFSIKGGVGRSTALAVAAWALAEEGKRVLVLDLDLESPGLSSSLLPPERCPAYGIADWLIEDLVDNGSAIFQYMTSLSNISNTGEVRVVPAHGQEAREYINKLGRAWMPKLTEEGIRELWYERLNRLITELEQAWNPDVILIDSRAGIDEVSAAYVTGLKANNILLFGTDTEQTWAGYKILFQHWNIGDSSQYIRDRLQMIGSMIQKDNGPEYFKAMCEKSYTIFSEDLYDSVPAGEPIGETFNFDVDNDEAPHYPLAIYWNRSITALSNLHSCFSQNTILEQIKLDFGQFIERIKRYV